MPAASARIGIVDAIYTRIGARDDLYRSQSTFMVEMSETARILSQATPRSLVSSIELFLLSVSQALLDEVGRGTAAKDGLAIGYAVLDHLAQVNGSRTLFATHAHELADMLAARSDFAFFCTSADNDVSPLRLAQLSSLRRISSSRYALRRGVSTESEALRVAELAGIPDAALRTARNTRSMLK